MVSAAFASAPGFTGLRLASSHPQSAGCADTNAGAPVPVASSDAPASSVLNQFGVLRLPPAASDALGTSEVDGLLAGVLSSFNALYVRRVATLADGTAMYLVPGYLSQTNCELAQTEQYEISQLQGAGTSAATAPVYCLVGVQASVETFTCYLFAGVSSGGALAPEVVGAKHPVTMLAGIVPDDVATVVLKYKHGQSVSSAVSDNFFASRQPPPPTALTKQINALLARAAREHRKLTAAELSLFGRLSSDAEADQTPVNIQWLASSGGLIASLNGRADSGLLISGARGVLLHS